VGLFGKKQSGECDDAASRVMDPDTLRQRGVLGQAKVIHLDSKPTIGGTMADPAYDCCITLVASADGIAPYTVTIHQHLLRSGVARLSGADVVAPAWVDRKDSSRVAIDLTARSAQPTL
jgi:hypothetical protein